MWTIKKTIKKGDYLYAVVPEHPNKTKNNYVLFHRVVVENHIGRLLTISEVVHHKDGNKHNNDIDNLEIMLRADHARLHLSTGRTYKKLKCPVCDSFFMKEARLIKENIKSKCSRRCNGIASRNIQLGRRSKFESW